jgi:acetyltransferase-like isoleucine patch superfamily enzyme
MIMAWLERWKLKRLIRQGLQIADDCRLVELPGIDSEPYLVSIGRHVTIARQVAFITHDGGTWVFRDQPEYREVIKYGRITIHDNCFIGRRAIIMPGVSVGPNSVVAAGSLVTRDVPPDTVVGGIPARPIKRVQDYAKESLAATPSYDRENYKRNKVAELLRLYPRPW